jgi:hypothetical protein
MAWLCISFSQASRSERLHRELLRKVSRRVPERELLRQSGRCEIEDRSMEEGLQQGATTLESWRSNPRRVCDKSEEGANFKPRDPREFFNQLWV